MIVVEGPDGGGKTTLVVYLVDKFNLPVAPKVVDSNTNAMVDLKAWTEEDVLKPHENIIYDRHRLVGEMIYGPVLRQHPEPGFDNIRWLTQRLIQFYQKIPLIIYCIPEWWQVLANLEGDPDNEVIVKSGHARTIYELYKMRACLDAYAGRNVIIYDYNRPMSLEVIDYAVAMEMRRNG